MTNDHKLWFGKLVWSLTAPLAYQVIANIQWWANGQLNQRTEAMTDLNSSYLPQNSLELPLQGPKDHRMWCHRFLKLPRPSTDHRFLQLPWPLIWLQIEKQKRLNDWCGVIGISLAQLNSNDKCRFWVSHLCDSLTPHQSVTCGLTLSPFHSLATLTPHHSYLRCPHSPSALCNELHWIAVQSRDAFSIL